jgi:hypothetical protein
MEEKNICIICVEKMEEENISIIKGNFMKK